MGAVTTSFAEQPARPQRWWQMLYVQVLIAIAAGVLVGAIWPAFGASLEWLGIAFVNLVKMIIAPVIFLTLVTGIAGARELGSLGRVVIKALAYFLFFSTLALILGLIVAHLVQPGASMHIDPHSLSEAKVVGFEKQAHETTVQGFLLAIIPTTLASALTSGSILQVLFVAILFGVALAGLGERVRPLLDLLEQLGTVVFRLVAILMRAAPVGAFGAMAFTIGKHGLGALWNLGGLVATFYATSALFVLVVLGLVGWLAGFSILKLLRYLKAELLLVLGASSSEAALPALIDKLERAGCDKEVVGVVVPAGYSFNLDGTNIYMTLAALFIAQATGVHLSLGEQLILLGTAMLTSKGAAGVTGAGFATLAATLMVVPSIPVAGMALILGVDRFMSECRSLTNFIGNAVATIVVARWEGRLDRDALQRALDGKADSGPARVAAETDPD
ncbi:C4-dicarboxylate transporter DctA [Sphingomonas sp. NIBR02145]|uniref:C4-dicarboxylate transporter DctA n=1 Tax=Sphingomonas sp. NIBR02145 TaxID=3014784 RepID=UPI0022B3A15C|nr:C4-dicarboxylate transporter DctA [Sphingomonas sp. NIBR02145]WHU03600.1 C4-dicarboxylate transporter DctA [Sphingomonas sp. NIBR02145]